MSGLLCFSSESFATSSHVAKDDEQETVLVTTVNNSHHYIANIQMDGDGIGIGVYPGYVEVPMCCVSAKKDWSRPVRIYFQWEAEFSQDKGGMLFKPDSEDMIVANFQENKLDVLKKLKEEKIKPVICVIFRDVDKVDLDFGRSSEDCEKRSK
ncbi:hypothetical protein [Paraburkholderia lacunae]|nr:hypothetical protein [Paraburkholderia lacunae]